MHGSTFVLHRSVLHLKDKQNNFTARCHSCVLHVHQNEPATCMSSVVSGVPSIEPALSRPGCLSIGSFNNSCTKTAILLKELYLCRSHSVAPSSLGYRCTLRSPLYHHRSAPVSHSHKLKQKNKTKKQLNHDMTVWRQSYENKGIQAFRFSPWTV